MLVKFLSLIPTADKELLSNYIVTAPIPGDTKDNESGLGVSGEIPDEVDQV